MKFSKYGFQRSHIPEVTGSSPVGPTNKIKGLGILPNPVFVIAEEGVLRDVKGAIPKFFLTYLMS